jgi:hypothetical protein
MSTRADKKTKVSPVEVPQPPNKPLTAFLQFRMDHFKQVQSENPGKKIGELSKIIGDMWKEIDPKDKDKYEAVYKKNHEKYTKEKEDYEKSFGKIKRKSSKSSEKTEKSKGKSKK